jgi:dolichyl-diphosphooligosaccharide--protein glycosyltransferase
VYTSKYGKVRIFKVLSVSKESRAWAADPANRECDAPGSWYCSGKYPPALKWLESKKKAFRQLEDFNRGGRDDAYYAEYMARMEGRGSGDAQPADSQAKPAAGGGGGGAPTKRTAAAAKAAAGGKSLRDEVLGKIQKMIVDDQYDALAHTLATQPDTVKLRSADGRGPLWWAYEAGRAEIAKLLLAAGADPEATDSEGMRPIELKP